MNVIDEINSSQPKAGPVVLTIGNFDGLHLGHQELLKRVREYAKKDELVSTVMTFDPHPSRVLRPQAAQVPRILEPQDVLALLRDTLSIQQVILQKFDTQFATLSADAFLKMLTDHLQIRAIIVGHDFAFGAKRTGTFEFLKKWASLKSIFVEQVKPLLEPSGGIISSSGVRNKILIGDVDTAAKWLSRPYWIRGQVVAGEGRGHQLGFSTANIAPTSELLPAGGVYVTRLFVENEEVGLPSVTNIGTKPTFHEEFQLTVETHALNVNRQFRESKVRLEFLRRLRDELKFPSARELISQIQKDVQDTKDFFGI